MLGTILSVIGYIILTIATIFMANAIRVSFRDRKGLVEEFGATAWNVALLINVIFYLVIIAGWIFMLNR